MNFRVFDSVTDLAKAAARTIALDVESRDTSVVALSGGSTPKPVYEILARDYLGKLASRRVVWVLGDERFVPRDDSQSNRKMIDETLFASGVPERHAFLTFDTLLLHEKAAAKFDRDWRALGVTKIDLAILGMGDEGHTASLFPGSPALEVTDRIAVDVYVEKVSMWRLTLTMPVLAAAAKRFVLAAGASKQPVLREVAGGGSDLPIARATREGETWWFVDRAAYPEDANQKAENRSQK